MLGMGLAALNAKIWWGWCREVQSLPSGVVQGYHLYPFGALSNCQIRQHPLESLRKVICPESSVNSAFSCTALLKTCPVEVQ